MASGHIWALAGKYIVGIAIANGYGRIEAKIAARRPKIDAKGLMLRQFWPFATILGLFAAILGLLQQFQAFLLQF